MISITERWKIVESYIKTHTAAQQSVESYNSFVRREFKDAITKAFDNMKFCSGSHQIVVNVLNIEIRDTTLMSNDADVPLPSHVSANPDVCRMAKCSLVAPVHLALQISIDDNKMEVTTPLCYLPVMVGSMLMQHEATSSIDQGYFILNGSEKVVVMQSKMSQRRVNIQNNRCTFYGTMWHLLYDRSKVLIVVKTHKILLGDLLLRLNVHKSLWPDGVNIDKKARVGNDKIDKAFPNLQKPGYVLFGREGYLYYGQMLCFMAKLLLRHCNKEKSFELDKDSLWNKHVEMPSELLLAITKSSLSRIKTSWSQKIIRFVSKNQLKRIYRALDSRPMTESFFYCLSTGNFPSFNGTIRCGVAQQRTNYNLASALSQIRTVHMGDERRNIARQREVRGCSYGYICPYDTAEGKTCGTAVHLAAVSSISTKYDESVMLSIISNWTANKVTQTRVFLNGLLYGYISKNKAKRFALAIRELRRFQKIHRSVSVCFCEDFGIRIRCDPGRLIRPLLLVSRMDKIGTCRDFDELEQRGIIDFVSSEEENELYVAVHPEDITTHTHCELHPSLFLSLNTLLHVPYANNNQGPRVTYQNAMQKQAMNYPSFNMHDQLPCRAHYLLYAQKPLCNTVYAETSLEAASSGINCVVAIINADGYNQEDAIVMSKGFIERGAFRTLETRCFQYSGEEEFGKEGIRNRFRNVSYKKVDSDGLPAIAQRLESNDVLIKKSKEGVDSSVLAKEKNGTVDRVIVGRGVRKRKRDSTTVNRIQIRTTKVLTPEVGDKFASVSAHTLL